MKAAFYCVTAYKKGNPYETYKGYQKNKAAIDNCIKWLTKEGYTIGHISKYVDCGTCYLMDLKWGDGGFVDFDLTGSYAVYQSMMPVTWE